MGMEGLGGLEWGTECEEGGMGTECEEGGMGTECDRGEGGMGDGV